MSDSEIQRFIADLKSDEAMRAELSAEASGVGSIVEFAKNKGFDITAEDVSAHMREQLGAEISDDQLDALAGGTGAVVSVAAVGGQTVSVAEVQGMGSPAVEAAVANVAVIVAT